MPSQGKKKTTPLLIPSIIFTILIIHHLKTKHNIHPRTSSPLHYSHEDNVLGNLKFIGKDSREVFDEEAVPESPKATKVTKPKVAMQAKPSAPKATKDIKPAGDKTPKPTSSQPPKPKPTSTKPSKAVLEKKQKLVKETPSEPLPAKRSKNGLVGKRRKPKSPLKFVDEFSDEDEGITMTNSETKSDEIVTHVNKENDASNRELTKINARVQDEGQDRSNPGKQDEGQARSNLGNATEFQPQPIHVTHAGPNLEPMDLAVSDASTQQNPEQMDEEFTTIAYTNV
nr:hypothetical protein [Tanacetum cinerariifolium]